MAVPDALYDALLTDLDVSDLRCRFSRQPR